MKKFARQLALAGLFAIGAGAAVVNAPALAQTPPKGDTKAKPADPKPDPKTKADPKVDPPKAGVKGSVVIKPGKDGKFRFFVRDEDEKSLMQSSTGYATEDEAKKMLEQVKAILGSAKVTNEKPEKTDK